MEKTINGIVASRGIAIGSALLMTKCRKIDTRVIPKDEIPIQINKLTRAVEMSQKELDRISADSKDKIPEKELKIIEALKELLRDTSFADKIIKLIQEDQITADHAVSKATNYFSSLFLSLDDDYMKQKSSDIKDVGNRILDNLLNEELSRIEKLTEPYIIISDDLFPSDTIQMDRSTVLGFATDLGGKTSHTAIIATALEIPAVVAAKNATRLIHNGDLVIIDGLEGRIIINPEKETQNKYQLRLEKDKKNKATLEMIKNLPAETMDGHTVNLSANISSIEDADTAVNHCADGIGLMRTELQYLGRSELPSEDELFKLYKAIAEKMGSKPLIIRTLDVGGDKNIPYLNREEEANPFLGIRGIRFCLKNIWAFKDQIRAILRAGCFGNIKMMFPMVTTIEEVRTAKVIVEEVKEELRFTRIPFCDDVEIGIMVEVPAVALMADLFIKEVDFFSIGSNDLTQYTLAADRLNEKLIDLYSPYNLAILRMICQTIDASHKDGKWTGICGQMATDPYMIMLLLGMGIDELSVVPSLLNETKHIIRTLSFQKATDITKEVLDMSSYMNLYGYMQKVYDSAAENQ